jgi:glycosyltransferase involved in cell wall biosynthesis
MSVRQLPEPMPPPTGKQWLGLIPSPELWRRRLIWRRWLPARCCHAIIFNSRRVAEAYKSEYRYPSGRVRVIPNGEEARAIRPAAPSGKPCSIGTVGRVSQAKGADLMFDAFAALASRHAGSRLVYYGDGPLISELQARAARAGLADRVVLAGYKADREAIYNDIDIYVQPSRRESSSNSVIEAMARGIPCVVTDIGGLPETVLHERTGLVVPGDDASALAAAVERLLSDQEARFRFGAAGQDRVRRDFQIGDVMRRTTETILGGGREGGRREAQ